MFDNHSSFMDFYGDVCEDPRDPIERKLAVIKKGRNVAFGGKGSAPDPNPGMLASAEAAKVTADTQKQIAGDSLAFYKQQYADLKPTLDKIMKGQVDSQDANNARASEYADYEKNTFRPLEKQMVDAAKAYNTDSKREELARTASADVTQGFDSARGQLGRQLASAGVKANSNRFAALNSNMLMQEALGRAGAQNGARTQADQLGYARMQDAASLGRNLASNASTAYSVGINAGDSGGRAAQAGGNMMGQGFQTAGNLYSGAQQGYGTAGNIYGQEFSGRMQGYQANQAASGALMSGLGSLAGGWASGGFAMPFADGGKVKRRGLRFADGMHVGAGPVSGPGGPVDDKVPAMLSDGEYVIPADTARAIGRDKLDKIVKKTHTPAAVQRQRKALKGKK
jgi:hypothetical protein